MTKKRSEKEIKKYYDSKKGSNELEVQDYMIGDKPITYSLYEKMIIIPIKENLQFNENDIVLDVGCGTGLVLKEIEKKVKSIEGIDISQNLLDFYKGESKLYCNSVLDFEYKQNYYTKIYMVSVSIHFESLDYFKLAVTNLLGALAKGGTLLIGDQLIAEFHNSKKYFCLHLEDLTAFLIELGYHFSIKCQVKEFRYRNRYDILIYK
jgi:SAM-dependent methyltransferase|tara:strand:- start:485 stop:1105 length:621 start_codon:yes stop_codon:yes gene_type:complete